MAGLKIGKKMVDGMSRALIQLRRFSEPFLFGSWYKPFPRFSGALGGSEGGIFQGGGK